MKALWLEPGSAPVPMTLKNDSVAVRDGHLHGHFPGYRNGAQDDERLMLAFGHYQTIPHQMKHVGGNVYKATSALRSWFSKSCSNSFVYMHPGSVETTLRIGFKKDGECKVLRCGGTPASWWAINQLQPDTSLPSDINTTEPVYSIRLIFGSRL